MSDEKLGQDGRTVERELRLRIHNLEKHNQFFARCESGWCNPSKDCDPARGIHSQFEPTPMFQGDRVKLESSTPSDQDTVLRIHQCVAQGDTESAKDELTKYHRSRIGLSTTGYEETRKMMNEIGRSTISPEVLVNRWNNAFPVGTRVRYWTGINHASHEGLGKTSVTRAPAQVMGGHTAVVWVEGQADCIALTHVEPLA